MLVTGRCPFPIRVLRFADPDTDEDWDTIERSHQLGLHFHGIVELRGFIPRSVLEAGGWRTYHRVRMPEES
jgi:hypothetical protein